MAVFSSVKNEWSIQFFVYGTPFSVMDWIYIFLYVGSKSIFRMVAVFPVAGDFRETLWKNGGMIRYTSCPGFGKGPIMEKATKDPTVPLSSFPGSPSWVGGKQAGMYKCARLAERAGRPA